MALNLKNKKTADWAEVLDLVIQAETDREAAKVLNDWCLERNRWGGAAWLLWELSKPGPTQHGLEVTQLIIGRETVVSNYDGSVPRNGGYYKIGYPTHSFRGPDRQWLDPTPEQSRHAADTIFTTTFREAERQLLLHEHARWVRVVSNAASQVARGSEVVVDYQSKQIKGLRYHGFRSRCSVIGCVNYIIGSSPAPLPGSA